jgi:hypothetical protein
MHCAPHALYGLYVIKVLKQMLVENVICIKLLT